MEENLQEVFCRGYCMRQCRWMSVCARIVGKMLSLLKARQRKQAVAMEDLEWFKNYCNLNFLIIPVSKIVAFLSPILFLAEQV